MIELITICVTVFLMIVWKIYNTIKTRYFLVSLQYRDLEFNIRFLEIQLKSSHGKFPQRSSIIECVLDKFPDIVKDLLTVQNIYEFKNKSDFDFYTSK